jgi:hypothetical protein
VAVERKNMEEPRESSLLAFAHLALSGVRWGIA